MKWLKKIYIIGEGGGEPPPSTPAAGFIASVLQIGFNLVNRFSLLAGEVKPGISVDATRNTFRGPNTNPAVSTSLIGASGTATQSVNPAIALSLAPSSVNTPVNPAISVSPSLRNVDNLSHQQKPAFLTSLLGIIGQIVKPNHTPAINLSFAPNIVSPSSIPQNPAISISPSLRSVDLSSIVQRPAFLTSLVGANGEATKPSHNPAIDIDASLRSSSPANIAQLPAFNLVQVVYNLNRRVGGNLAANVTGTWTNLANAEGRQNNTDATSSGALAGATRKMRLDYANHVLKTELIISQVLLHIYIQSDGNTSGLLGNITFAYNIGAGEVIPAGWNARTDTFDFTTTPNTIDITTAIGGDWAKLDALQTFITHVYAAASATFVCSVDAIEVEIVASKTDAL